MVFTTDSSVKTKNHTMGKEGKVAKTMPQTCRICLIEGNAMLPLFRYQLSGNYAEMLTAVADVKVASNDGLPDTICKKCCAALEKAYLLKSIAERSDRTLRKKMAKLQANAPTKKISFDSITDIKSEISTLAVKKEPKWEMEIDLSSTCTVDTIEGKDITIANTVIRKVESAEVPDTKTEGAQSEVWKKKSTSSDYYAEYLDDDIFQDDNDNDEDYAPPTNKKSKFKKPKLKDIKVFKENKGNDKIVGRRVKVIREVKQGQRKGSGSFHNSTATSITCYPIMKNGVRGPPILLRRPKDATILKVHPNYKSRVRKPPSQTQSSKPKEKRVRIVKGDMKIKEREKLVCPICGILTYTLGNHMATHQEKKKFTCPECNKAFGQKGNLQVHMKQHTGVKDYICDICGAGFYSQKGLVRHNLIHKGERPFACNLCNKKFIARCDLNRHLRIHSGYKPFKCDVCTMSFNAKHQLQNHSRMHSGERPYSCQMCNVAFSYKVNLNNHVFKVHGVNLKFKSIHVVTEEILRKEMGLANETRLAVLSIGQGGVPTPAAHETVQQDAEYNQ